MKIYDESKTIMLQEQALNFNVGYLMPDKLLIETIPSYVEKETTEAGLKCTYHPEKKVYEDVYIYKPYNQKQLLEIELAKLEEWFQIEYRQQFEKCTRKMTLGLNLKDGTSPQLKLGQLYAEAESKSIRINQLRTLLASML